MMMIDLNAVVDEHGVRPVYTSASQSISEDATGKALPAEADRVVNLASC